MLKRNGCSSCPLPVECIVRGQSIDRTGDRTVFTKEKPDRLRYDSRNRVDLYRVPRDLKPLAFSLNAYLDMTREDNLVSSVVPHLAITGDSLSSVEMRRNIGARNIRYRIGNRSNDCRRCDSGRFPEIDRSLQADITAGIINHDVVSFAGMGGSIYSEGQMVYRVATWESNGETNTLSILDDWIVSDGSIMRPQRSKDTYGREVVPGSTWVYWTVGKDYDTSLVATSTHSNIRGSDPVSNLFAPINVDFPEMRFTDIYL